MSQGTAVVWPPLLCIPLVFCILPSLVVPSHTAYSSTRGHRGKAPFTTSLIPQSNSPIHKTPHHVASSRARLPVAPPSLSPKHLPDRTYWSKEAGDPRIPARIPPRTTGTPGRRTAAGSRSEERLAASECPPCSRSCTSILALRQI